MVIFINNWKRVYRDYVILRSLYFGVFLNNLPSFLRQLPEGDYSIGIPVGKRVVKSLHCNDIFNLEILE